MPDMKISLRAGLSGFAVTASLMALTAAAAQATAEAAPTDIDLTTVDLTITVSPSPVVGCPSSIQTTPWTPASDGIGMDTVLVDGAPIPGESAAIMPRVEGSASGYSWTPTTPGTHTITVSEQDLSTGKAYTGQTTVTVGAAPATGSAGCTLETGSAGFGSTDPSSSAVIDGSAMLSFSAQEIP